MNKYHLTVSSWQLIALFVICCWIIQKTSGIQDKIQPFIFPPNIREGESTKVMCAVTTEDKFFSFKWYKNGITITKQNRVEITEHSDYSLLKIKTVSFQDSGNYTCVAENAKSTLNYTAVLLVEAPVQWIMEPSDKEVKLGEKVNIFCSARGLPSPVIEWTRISDGRENPLKPSGRFEMGRDGTLTISDVQSKDSGSYVCYARNGVGNELQKKVSLRVIVPARFDEKFTVVTVKKGDSASLRCEAIGDQPLSVIWKRDGKELRKINGGRYEIFETLTPKGLKSELVLREADRTDGQLYTCLTENPYGKDERSIKLLVMEVPATPLDLKVQEVWSRSVSVSWSPPYTGNSPITKYVLQYWRDAASGGRHRLEEKVVTSAQTSALIKDLHPGTNYGLAIVAENTVGRGEPSDTVSFSTGEEEPSGAPMDVNVDVKGAASLLVTWKAPPKSEWNGKLKGYYVGYKIMHDSNHPYSFKTVDYVPGGVQEHMITSLRKDTEYSIIVKAFNSAGSGPPSQDVIVRTLGG
ncbi:Down syndrome cell adhesion molecule-like protein Dscam2, partial [Stegodyphus mimosarum]